MKAFDEKIKKVSELRGRDTELHQAAYNLVIAVEKYLRQECLRSELYQKKETLKELLNATDSLD